MSDKEKIVQRGFGTESKSTVSVRSGDKVSGHGDQKFSDTKAAFSNASDNKKA